MAAWDGTSWSPLGTGVNGPVTVLSVHRDTLVAGGLFSEAGGVPALHVACWTGAAWDSLGGGLGEPRTDSVDALATFNDQLVAGGSFLRTGFHASRWNAGYWLGLGFLDGPVHSYAVYQGRLIAGGAFRNNRIPGANVVARWNE